MTGIDFLNVWIVVAGGLILAFILYSIATFYLRHKWLRVSVRKLDDGRYRVRYYWSTWEEHLEYCDTLEDVQKLFSKLLGSMKVYGGES